MNLRKQTRLKRAKRPRRKMIELKALRLSVHRTAKHIYAQAIDHKGNVLAAASSVEKAIAEGGYTGNAEMAKRVGKTIADRLKDKGVSQVAFDRSGFRYHGRIQVLADTVRENGIAI